MESINFFKEGLKNIKTVGTLTRSSKYLCKDMVKHVDFTNTTKIVELGAGDGAITKHILNNMRPDAQVLAFEILPQLYKRLNTIEDKRLHPIMDDVEKIGVYLEKYNMGQAECMISAIPFVGFPQETTEKILTACKDSLAPNGLFIQVHYSLLTRKYYKKIFGNVKIHFSPFNMPPAFVLVSQKKG